jgi:hypothetical protein
MGDPFSGLQVKAWWHAFIVVGAAGIISSIAFKVDFISQRDCFLFFFGLFLFGVGAWINHPRQERIIAIGKITSYYRQSTAFGLLLEIGGGLLVLKELWKIIFTNR